MIPARIARLKKNGSTDYSTAASDTTSFRPQRGLDAAAHAVAVLPGGGVMVGGSFTHADGLDRRRIAFFQEDGTLQATVAQADAAVRFLLPQSDGKVIVGGDFTALAGLPRGHMARLRNDLSLEPGFDPGTNAAVLAGALQADGKILLGGNFTQVDGTARTRLARLFNDPVSSGLRLQPDLAHSAGEDYRFELVWSLSGASPSGVRATFEKRSRTGGLWGAWESLDKPNQMDGEWILGNLDLDDGAEDGEMRARLFPGDSHSQGVTEEVITYSCRREVTLAMEQEEDGLVVEVVQPTSNAGTPHLLPATEVGRTRVLELLLRNDGLKPLQLTARGGGRYYAMDTGSPSANQWTVTMDGLDATGIVKPLSRVRVLLTFQPTEKGMKTDRFTIQSNDADEPELTVCFQAEAIPGPGSRDVLWQSSLTRDAANQKKNNLVKLGALAIRSQKASRQVGGKEAVTEEEHLLLGGEFEFVRGNPRNRFAQLTLDAKGSLLLQNGKLGAASGVNCIAVLQDGRFLLGGLFSKVNNNAVSPFLTCMNKDGSVDASFNKLKLKAGNHVHAMAVQADGNIIASIDQTVKEGKITKIISLVRRFTPAGVWDSTFNAGVNGLVRSIVIQKDGFILIGGNFSQAGNAPRNGLARLRTDGSLDASFAPEMGAGSVVKVIALQPVKNAPAGPDHVLAYVTGSGLKRFGGLAGEATAAWTPVTADVQSLTVQADGCILAAGHNHAARYFETGVPDSSFVAGIGASLEEALLTAPRGLTVQTDGGVILGGGYRVDGTTYSLMRLTNDVVPKADKLAVINSGTLKWTRTLTAPDVQVVTFYLSEDGGKTWEPMNAGGRACVRVQDGWQLGGTPAEGTGQLPHPLPRQGMIMARGRLPGGAGNGSNGYIEVIREYPGAEDPVLEVPDLTVQYLNTVSTSNVYLVSGQAIVLPGGQDGSELGFGLRLKNTGKAELTGLSFASSNESVIEVRSVPATGIPPGGTLDIEVSYRPGLNRRDGHVRILSNVPGGRGDFRAQFDWYGIREPVISTTAVPTALITTTAAQLEATAIANDATASLHFFYWRKSSPAERVRMPGSSGYPMTSYDSKKTASQISGLLPATDYQFVAVVSNSGYSVTSPVKSFRTKTPVTLP